MPFAVFAALAVLATAVVTWCAGDLVYEIGLPHCRSGRRVVDCAGGHGWHDVSLVVTSLLTVPAVFALAGGYLYLSSRLVRAAKAGRRDAVRSALRRRFGLILGIAVVGTVPLTLLIRGALPAA